MHGNISEGLLITSVLTLVAANTLDLGRISTIGSAGFLVVFAAVNLARHRLRDAGDPGWPSLLGLLACLIALAALIAEVGGDDPIATAAAAGLFVGPFVIEAVYRGITGRSIRHRFHGASRHRHSTDD